jgi:SAM-dependent methyltransferase
MIPVYQPASDPLTGRDRDNGAVTRPSWDASYAGSVPPPWDVGHPQPAFVRLAGQGMLTGQLLDAGCGTGEHTLLAASSGADALGVDVSPLAIEQARGKAAARGIPAAAGGQVGPAAAGGQVGPAAAGGQVGPAAAGGQVGPAAAGGQVGTARFEVADALSLRDLGLSFDTIIDSGLFHVFDGGSRARYVTSLASVLRPGGRLYLMCFSDQQPGTAGPRRVTQDELRAAFGDGWTITAIRAETFQVNRATFGAATAQAWLATVNRH